MNRRSGTDPTGTPLVPRPLTRNLAVLGLAVLPMLAAGADGDIYRCEDGETTVFSDVPCDEAAEVHQLQRSLSVIASPKSLARIQQANAAYLSSVQAEREARRSARAERARREARAARYMPPAVRTVPVAPAYPFYPANPAAPGRRPSVEPNRLEARRDASNRRPRRATDESRPPLSAGGRQLGARREDDDG